MHCYLCNGTKFSTRPGKVRDNEQLRVIECSGCGLVTLSTLNHINDGHYENSGMHGDSTLPIQKWLKETAIDDERRFEMLKSKMAGRRVLDFGCGCGGFLMRAKSMAESCEGVELELRLQPFFQEQEIKVWTSLEELKSKQTGNFDLITSFHVFEHLPDPIFFVKELTQMLSAGGELVIEVPSSDDALLTLYNCEPFTNFTYWSQHLFLFNQHTLGEMIKQTGCQLRWIKQVQRYPLANHLHWLSKGKPGGHHIWSFLDDKSLNHAYSQQLAAIGKCDTLIAGIGK